VEDEDEDGEENKIRKKEEKKEDGKRKTLLYLFPGQSLLPSSSFLLSFSEEVKACGDGRRGKRGRGEGKEQGGKGRGIWSSSSLTGRGKKGKGGKRTVSTKTEQVWVDKKT
jgi:hypothetical protein